jgi:hypothetical protein
MVFFLAISSPHNAMPAVLREACDSNNPVLRGSSSSRSFKRGVTAHERDYGLDRLFRLQTHVLFVVTKFCGQSASQNYDLQTLIGRTCSWK